MKKLILEIKKILISKRFIAFYWSAGTMITAGFIDLLSQTILGYDQNNTFIVIFGLILAQITKLLNPKK